MDLSRWGTGSGGERGGDGSIISDKPGREGSEKMGEVRPDGELAEPGGSDLMKSKHD